MTDEKALALAKQAGFYIGEHIASSNPSGLQAFAQLVRDAALEEAAQLCDRFQERHMQPAECAGAMKDEQK